MMSVEGYMMSETFKAQDIETGQHPEGYRIDKTASAMNRYTKWTIQPDGQWSAPKPVCFDSLPQQGWHKRDRFNWEPEADS